MSSQSTKTGIAPISVIAPAVATKVLAAVITSSPGPTFKTFKESFIASVPELTPTANLVPIKFANLFSNDFNSFPNVKSPVETNYFKFFQRSSLLENCCFKYEYLTFIL